MCRVARCWPALAPYGLAVMSTALFSVLALLLRASLRPGSPGQIADSLLFVPVILSARFGGVGPALFAAALSVGCLELVFEPPLRTLSINVSESIRVTIFLFAAGLIGALNSRRQRAEDNVRHTEVELRTARMIQQKLFPPAAPPLVGVEVAGTSSPAEATGGDYFDYIPMRGGTVGIVVGDISGHGLGPAILMAETCACLRTLALTHDDAGAILTLANKLLVQDMEGDRFTTLFFACLDPQARSLRYAAAGHEGYLVDPRGGVSRLPSTALPLGIDREANFPCTAPIALEPGQVLLLATDGLSDARSADGTLFGTTRLLDMLRANRGETAREIHDRLCVAVRAFSGEEPQVDDITVVVLKVGPASALPPQAGSCPSTATRRPIRPASTTD